MFHNIPLHLSLSLLFPVKKVKLSDLPNLLPDKVTDLLSLSPETLDHVIGPCQAALAMRYKWVVLIAHTLCILCVEQSFSIFSSSRLCSDDYLTRNVLTAEKSPHSFKNVSANTDYNRWRLYPISQLERLCYYPFSPNLAISPAACRSTNQRVKVSLSVDQIERYSILFIGCLWNLTTDLVQAALDKSAKITALYSDIQQKLHVHSTHWKRLTEKITWLSLLNRPLLPCLNAAYLTSVRQQEEPDLILPFEAFCEVEIAINLLPLCSLDLGSRFATEVICFDASPIAGAITFTTAVSDEPQRPWHTVTCGERKNISTAWRRLQQLWQYNGFWV